MENAIPLFLMAGTSAHSGSESVFMWDRKFIWDRKLCETGGQRQRMNYGVMTGQKTELFENHLFLGGKNSQEEIRVNSRCLMRDGRPWIPIMGEIHYSRLEETQWERELLKMKAGGITVVSCYAIWIYHEETEGIFDFSGNRNLNKFLGLAEKLSLKVLLRIGPWVHGEVRNGGFPDWLLKKGCALRQDDPEYLSCVKRYFEKLMEQVGEYLFYNDGPVWGIQLENELTNQPGHLLTLRRLAEETGLKVPVYTVTGWNSKYGAEIPEYEVLPVFGGYPEAPWSHDEGKLAPNSNYFFLPARNDSSIGNDLIVNDDDNPDVFHMRYELYPYATCELGGGIAVTYHRRPVMGRDDVAALALVKLGCGNNLPGYYMYHGGTNGISLTTLQESKATGYPNDYPVRSYDFQAPIGEYGQIRASYRQLKQQHLFIQTFMESLALMDAYFQENPITDRYDTESLRYSVRSDGTSGFVFVNNFQRLDRLAQHEGVQFTVPCETGSLTFPKNGIPVPSGAYFILPYHLDLGGVQLCYATAQPLYRKDNTWFFFAPFGITAEYCFEEGQTGKKTVLPKVGREHVLLLEGKDETYIRIVTLTQEEAGYFYVLDDEAYVTEGAELYLAGNTVCAYREADPNLSYSRWNGTDFEKIELLGDRQWESNISGREQRAASEAGNVKCQEFAPELSGFAYASELFPNGRNPVRGYRLEIPEDWIEWVRRAESVSDLLLEISYHGDVMQIYVDGTLAADDYCKGIPLKVSLLSLLQHGRNIELLISEMKEGSCYLEREGVCGLSLDCVKMAPVWESRGINLYKEGITLKTATDLS